MKSKRYLALMLVVVVSMFMASCGAGKKTAATSAITAAANAYDAAQRELTKYVPDEAKSVEDAINAAKVSLEKGDYEAALAAATPIPDKVTQLTVAAAAKKDELTTSWQVTSAGVAEMLQSIRGKLTIYSIPKERPANMDKAKLAAAGKSYEEAAAAWEEAKNDVAAKNLADAIAKAQAAREKAAEAMKILGLKVPAMPTVPVAAATPAAATAPAAPAPAAPATPAPAPAAPKKG